MVSFDFCGTQSQSCSNYFLSKKYNNIENETNATYLSGVNYLKSWSFNVKKGINLLNITEPEVYSKGSIVMISTPNNSTKIQMTIASNISSADYVFGRSLSKINPNESNIFYRLCIRAITKRYIYNFTNGSISQTFNASGSYSFLFNVSQKSTNYFQTSVFNVIVKPGMNYK